MHSSALRAGSMSAVIRQEHLQQAIKEKQLCERRHHACALMLRKHDLVGVLAPRGLPELRIQGSPAQVRKPHPTVSPMPLPSDLGSPESIIFAITYERRRLSSQIVPVNSDSGIAALVAPSTPSQSRQSPSKEFATRLSRLHKAAALGLAAIQGQWCDSLHVSPIGAQSSAVKADASFPSYLNGSSALFGDRGEVSGLGCCEVEGARHVRFSSRSPQVATFSVERPCVPRPEGWTATESAPAAMPETPPSEVAKLIPGPELDLVQRSPSTHRNSNSPWVSTLVMSPCVASPHSTIPSPQTSVTSYLSRIEELRSSLLEAPWNPRQSNRRLSDDARLPTQPVQMLTMAENPSGMNEKRATNGQDVWESAPAPLKQWTLDQTRCLGESVGAAAVGITSPTASGAVGLIGPLPRGASLTPAMSETFECFTESSPIFLRRPQRRPKAPTQDTRLSPLFSNVTNQLTESSTPPPPRPRMPGKKDALVTHKATKKCVRFHESVERSDKGGTSTACKRRRSERRAAQPPTSAPAVVGVPIIMAAELCCEQEGFGAGILLACGPTLYFD
nr:unnamed protein product [Leishmania braziliensis]